MHKLMELKEMLCEELEEYGSKEKLDVGGLEVVDKLAHAIKNIDKILESSEEYSMEGGMGGNSYRGGQSRARGRGANARRDSRGRYSSYEGRGGSSRYGGGSSRYGGGSSRYGGSSYDSGIDDLVEEITDVMEELPEHIKKDAQKFVKKLEEMM